MCLVRKCQLQSLPRFFSGAYDRVPPKALAPCRRQAIGDRWMAQAAKNGVPK